MVPSPPMEMPSVSYGFLGCPLSRSWPAPSLMMRTTPGSTSSVMSPETGISDDVGEGGGSEEVGSVGDSDVAGEGDPTACAGLRSGLGAHAVLTRKPPKTARIAPATASFVALNMDWNLHHCGWVET